MVYELNSEGLILPLERVSTDACHCRLSATWLHHTIQDSALLRDVLLMFKNIAHRLIGQASSQRRPKESKAGSTISLTQQAMTQV